VVEITVDGTPGHPISPLIYGGEFRHDGNPQGPAHPHQPLRGVTAPLPITGGSTRVTRARTGITKACPATPKRLTISSGRAL
jgi:hypothetical protein